jgi:hypothetical protein
MRILSGLLALVLALFAYLQIDDPDPHIWIPIYLLGALWPAIAAFGPGRYAARPPVRIGAWLSAAFFLAGFLWLAPTIGRDWIHVEKARESIGYLICAVATLVGIWTAARYNRNRYAD